MIGLLAVAAVVAASVDGPVEFGRAEIARAAGAHAGRVRVRVRGGGPAESYVIRAGDGRVTITGADARGAMYGALEFAERLRMRGPAAWREGAEGRPWLGERGMNLFLTLPWDSARSVTDHDPTALTDPRRWYFQNDAYWRSLFDLMARARLNWLDIHGMWDVHATDAPNLYAYFIQSVRYPQVGVDPAIKAANLRQLNRVIAMAHARGIRISLMAYQATLSIPQNPRPPYRADEALLYDYTREMVEKMIRQAPGLDAIGFRIGESGKGEAFFRCYIDAVRRSGRNIPLITRSWLTRKRRVLELARAFDDFTVEVKYNGEQWGPSYMAAGGRMANWYSYSFEDYLSDSGPGAARRTWRGHPAIGGGRWPDQPYRIVWQVRANGTHRIFPFYEPERVRQSILQMKVGSASGYSVEGLNAYYPAAADYYLADSSQRSGAWVHDRDELYWQLWGRLGYDPRTPEAVFELRMAEWFGPAAGAAAQAWKTASRIVPLAFSAFSLGPDHRNHAPELEWGGTTDDFVTAEPFDSHAFRGVREEVADAATGGMDGRPRASEVARVLGDAASDVERALPALERMAVPADGRRRWTEMLKGLRMLSHLGAYYCGRFLAARSVAANEAALGRPVAGPEGAAAMQSAAAAWRGLSSSAESRFYRPFTERLRMRTGAFHWRSQLSAVEAEGKRLAAGAVRTEGLPSTGPAGAADVALAWRMVGDEVECSAPARGLARAWLLVKPLPSASFFHKIAMERQGVRFVARFRRENWGHCIAAEVAGPGGITRVPSALAGRVPYLVVPARAGPTPPLYSAEEAMSFLAPHVLTPDRYGMLLIGARAWAFHRFFPLSVRRKLLDPVSRGMTLVALHQDWTSGRYPLDWLPGPLRAVNRSSALFDPAGALGMPRVNTADIMRQAFVAGGGWDTPGNGGVAHRRWGRGEIWVVSARLLPRLADHSAAEALVRLLQAGGNRKPAVLIDSGTEGADKCSSVIPDMMNAHGVPFLTLGEVIAKEQGMASMEPVAGLAADDSVLEGRGPAMMSSWLAKRVRARAAAPTAPDAATFERERARRRAEILRALGLSPMPPRTPLNTRTTGTHARRGYRVENIVLESRPRFFVTVQAYVPDAPAGTRFPVVINPIGHWAHKKAEPVVQARCIFQALRGYLAVVVDSPGHSFEGDIRIERRPEGVHNDFKLVQGGANVTGTYVWDLMRVLDYVSTRPDADMGHVGLTGASGGGLATLYAFAADDRYACAAPVVYVSSMELAPDNGCLCNHVPGTLQVGDRSDVLGIQAPKPVLVIGAENDGEFPADAMRLTGEKLKCSWTLFGAAERVTTRIFPGGHDYSRPMREAAMGFFDRWLKGVGDGSPVPEPELETAGPADPAMFVLSEPAADERTLRELAREGLQRPGPGRFDAVVRVNGGLPARTPLAWRELGAGARRHVTFEAEPGITIPGVLWMPSGRPRGCVVMLSDSGKAAADGPPEQVARGYACLRIDARGVGELAPIDQRHLTYLGVSLAFLQAWDLVRAAEGMRAHAPVVDIVGDGPIASLAALYAGLTDPLIRKVTGLQCLREWADVFEDGVPDLAVQPRANLIGRLSDLRAQLPTALWRFRSAAGR